jgi:hypothetical protein
MQCLPGDPRRPVGGKKGNDVPYVLRRPEAAHRDRLRHRIVGELAAQVCDIVPSATALMVTTAGPLSSAT